MEKFKFISRNNLSKLPETTGVYAFYGGESVLYIGKAVNIKNRVKNHFYPVKQNPLDFNFDFLKKSKLFNRANQPSYRDNLFLEKTEKIGYIETDSEIEALILEANLIKKILPKFNVVWKDGKNYFYVVIAQNKEKIPYVFITHQIKKTEIRNPKQIQNSKFKIQNSKFRYVGPFVDGKALKQTLRILRRIFPFYSAKKHSQKLCPYCHLGLCPGPNPNLKEYKKNIRNFIAFFKGKKKFILKNLKKEMETASKREDFEKAKESRDKISVLEKILAHKKVFGNGDEKNNNWRKTRKILQSILKTDKEISKIEGYDISNIQGEEATGSMVVFINGKPVKNLYRKFRIKTIKTSNDIAMLKEVFERRLKHSEWSYPDLMLIDGGKAQLNIAIKSKFHPAKCETNFKTISKSKFQKIKILSLAKRNNELYIEGKNKPILLKNLPQEIYNLILQIRDESHRFAKSYHKKLREAKFANG